MPGNVFCFEGRRGRLSYFLTSLLIAIASAIAGTFLRNFASSLESHIYLGISVLLIPLVSWPCFAIGAQRFHDLGASGWWQLLCLIPFVGFIIWLVLLFAPGQKQANQYGYIPSPEYVMPATSLK